MANKSNRKTRRMGGSKKRGPSTPKPANPEVRMETKVDAYHDDDGKLVTSGLKVDLCDCLSHSCPGCFWPCAGCGGRRCAVECQSDRQFILTSTAQSGRGLEDPNVVKNPYVPETYFEELKRREEEEKEKEEREKMYEFKEAEVDEKMGNLFIKKVSKKERKGE